MEGNTEVRQSGQTVMPRGEEAPPPLPPVSKPYQFSGILAKDIKEPITGFKKAMVKSMANAWVSFMLLLKFFFFLTY